jgi:hypothetical protein
LILRAIQKDSVALKYSSRGMTYVPYRRQFRVRSGFHVVPRGEAR